MPKFTISPHSGLNKIFPENKLVSKKEQEVQKLINLLSLDGKISKIAGADRYDGTPRGNGKCRWAKRIYYKISGDDRRRQFAVLGDTLYKGNSSEDGFEEAEINDAVGVHKIEPFFCRDVTVKAAGEIITYMVDSKNFFKFTPNTNGDWEKITDRTDIDGVTIEPIDIIEHQDRLWVLQKESNVLLASENLSPESFSNSTSSVKIQLPPGLGGFPVRLIKFSGFLYVMHEDYMCLVTGSSPSTYGVKEGNIIEKFGCRAPLSVETMKDRFVFLNSYDNEIYQSRGTIGTTEILSYKIRFKDLVNVNKTENVAITFHDDLLRVAYEKTGDTLNDNEIIYSFNEQKWCGETEGRKISVYCQWNGKNDKNELLTGHSDQGLLMINDRGLNFDGEAIHYKLETASYEISPMNDVRFEYLWVEANPLGDFTIPITYYLDNRITTSETENISMRGEIIGVGLIVIKDQEIFVERGRFKYDYARGRNIKIIIEETQLDRVFELFNIHIKYNRSNMKTTKHLVGR